MIYINPNLHWEEVFFNVSVGCNWPSGLKKENKNVAPGTTQMKDYNKKLIKTTTLDFNSSLRQICLKSVVVE